MTTGTPKIPPTNPATITEHELQQVEQTASGCCRSWDRRKTLFEKAGYIGLTPGWPDDPDTVDEAKAHPEAFAHKSIGQGCRPLRHDHPPLDEKARRHRPLVRRPARADSGAPLFQASTANLNPWTDAKVDTENPARGPLLIISGEKDNTVPWAIANASYQQERNDGVTEIVEMPNRGHALTIDGGWPEVAERALAFVQRFVK
jgi:pimeloyl-ACP methyl ester carboxylesterase